MPQMSKVELYAAIRRYHRAGMTMRELERKYNVAWRTVRKALDGATYAAAAAAVGSGSVQR